MDQAKPVIELKGISKSFYGNCVLHDLSLSLLPGKFYALMGRNGVGKSTLLRILGRQETPDKGSGMILGYSLDEDVGELNAKVGYLTEALDFVLPISISEIFQQISKLYPRWDLKLFEATLDVLKLDSKKYFRDLSRGQKMQVALAWVLASHPQILLLDEISAVLDAHARRFFLKRLREFVLSGGTILFATNIVSEVQNYADEMIVLNEGGQPQHMPVSQLEQYYKKLRKQESEVHKIFDDPQCVEVGVNSDGSSSYLISLEACQSYVLNPVWEDRRRITAEEVFIYYTRKEKRDGWASS